MTRRAERPAWPVYPPSMRPVLLPDGSEAWSLGTLRALGRRVPLDHEPCPAGPCPCACRVCDGMGRVYVENGRWVPVEVSDE